ncbi:MAG: hypothetical protein CM15mP125_0980 [Gammaproteobacteria bacterium]|nr:MAG: hypothetical protein CM15mP125_0980 [Gammaproteobacteria bacterium]
MTGVSTMAPGLCSGIIPLMSRWGNSVWMPQNLFHGIRRGTRIAPT